VIETSRIAKVRSASASLWIAPEAREKSRREHEAALEKSRREREVAIKDKAAALIEQHGLKTARAFAESLLAVHACDLPELLRHILGVDVEQPADGEAA
jgi:hypothetical protein